MCLEDLIVMLERGLWKGGLGKLNQGSEVQGGREYKAFGLIAVAAGENERKREQKRGTGLNVHVNVFICLQRIYTAMINICCIPP
jgi:hypothetical protein